MFAVFGPFSGSRGLGRKIGPRNRSPGHGFGQSSAYLNLEGSAYPLLATPRGHAPFSGAGEFGCGKWACAFLLLYIWVISCLAVFGAFSAFPKAGAWRSRSQSSLRPGIRSSRPNPGPEALHRGRRPPTPDFSHLGLPNPRPKAIWSPESIWVGGERSKPWLCQADWWRSRGSEHMSNTRSQGWLLSPIPDFSRDAAKT